MPSSFSTNLKLELMATGEDSGIWGNTTNTNLGTLIEQAIVGSATVAMADANQTISISNGTSSTGRCVFITCTGALTALRTLTVPTVNKNYVVFNSTTGGFAITVKTSGGTGIDVAAGTKRAVFADSTNVTDMVTGFGDITFGNATVTTINKVTITAPASGSTLTIANGKTFTVNNTLTLAGTDGTTIDFSTIIPTGMMLPFASNTLPSTTQWLACNAQAVSRATYATLFGVIGTTYGIGDGSTTFNVPDMRGRVPAGMDVINGSANAARLSPGFSNSTVIGTGGGAATNTAQTSMTSTGSNAINFGAIAISGATIGSSDNTAQAANGVDFTASTNSGHFGVSGNTAAINGSFGISVAGSASSSAFATVPPTIVMNYLIKT